MYLLRPSIGAISDAPYVQDPREDKLDDYEGGNQPHDAQPTQVQVPSDQQKRQQCFRDLIKTRRAPVDLQTGTTFDEACGEISDHRPSAHNETDSPREPEHVGGDTRDNDRRSNTADRFRGPKKSPTISQRKAAIDRRIVP